MSDQLTKHFARHEFACRGERYNGRGFCCGGSSPIDVRIPNILEAVRARVSSARGVDTPLHLNSAFRCLKYNCLPKAAGGVGSTSGSQHPKGTAVDIRCPPDFTIDEFAALIKEVMDSRRCPGGIGKYTAFVHMDLRGNWAFWDERE